MTSERRKYRRERRYGVRTVTVALTEDIRRDMEREADRDNVSLASMLRRALDVGWPRVKEAARKRRTRSGINSGTGAGQCPLAGSFSGSSALTCRF